VPVVPFTHNHRRHAIDPADYRVRDRHDNPNHVDDEPVTVADLLDLRDAAFRAYRDGHYWNAVALDEALDRADHDTKRSYGRLTVALDEVHKQRHSLSRLSPEERAEFEARTRQNG
jgi:hypothetical protein